MPRPAVLVVLLLAAAPAVPAAQGRPRGYVEPSPRSLELTPQGGMFWSGTVTGSLGKLVFDVAPEAALTASFPVDERSQVELLYLFARPQARFVSSSALHDSSPSFGVTTQALQVGGLTAFEVGTVEPFLSGGLGIAWYHPATFPDPLSSTIEPADAVVFSFHLGGGVKWWLSDVVGIRVGARLLFPVLFSGGAFLSGPNGAELLVNAGIPAVQGDLTLGLVVSP